MTEPLNNIAKEVGDALAGKPPETSSEDLGAEGNETLMDPEDQRDLQSRRLQQDPGEGLNHAGGPNNMAEEPPEQDESEDRPKQ